MCNKGMNTKVSGEVQEIWKIVKRTRNKKRFQLNQLKPLCKYVVTPTLIELYPMCFIRLKSLRNYCEFYPSSRYKNPKCILKF